MPGEIALPPCAARIPTEHETPVPRLHGAANRLWSRHDLAVPASPAETLFDALIRRDAAC